MGNERTWGKDTKEMLCSYKDVKVVRVWLRGEWMETTNEELGEW